MTAIHEQCPFTPPITIICYAAESEVAFSPDREHVESRHQRIWQFFNTGDVFKARIKACRTVQQEMKRFAEHKKDSAHPDSPYQGLKLYFEYRINESGKGKKDKVHRFYLLDGQSVTKTELLERMEQESLFLVDAGNIFQRVEVDDVEGRVFMVAADGMV